MKKLSLFALALAAFFSHSGFAACSDVGTMVTKIQTFITVAKTNCLTVGDNSDYTSDFNQATRYCALAAEDTTFTYTADGTNTESITTQYVAREFERYASDGTTASTNDDGSTPKREVHLWFKKVSDGLYNFHFVVVAGETLANEQTGIFYCTGVLNDSDTVDSPDASQDSRTAIECTMSGSKYRLFEGTATCA